MADAFPTGSTVLQLAPVPGMQAPASPQSSGPMMRRKCMSAPADSIPEVLGAPPPTIPEAIDSIPTSMSGQVESTLLF